jgi:RNA recognition motif-containing protein
MSRDLQLRTLGVAVKSLSRVAGSRVTERRQIMRTRLYVGNLPYDATEAQLRELFAQDQRQVGEIAIITDRATGRPRGFAFVEMGSQTDAQSAVLALHGLQFGARTLIVNEAREPAPRGGGPSLGGRRPGRDRLRL